MRMDGEQVERRRGRRWAEGYRPGVKTSVYLTADVAERVRADSRSASELLLAGLEADWGEVPVRVVSGRVLVVAESVWGPAASRARGEGTSVALVVEAALRFYGSRGGAEDVGLEEPESSGGL